VNATIWDRVDEPVLSWVSSLPSVKGRWDFTMCPTPPPSGVIEGLDDRDMHEALMRLVSYELVYGQHAAAHRTLRSGHTCVSPLRASSCSVNGPTSIA
jgi:hypothetical protein